jgi:signal transduction histidine kinase/CHASE1-domain containing sensor protein
MPRASHHEPSTTPDAPHRRRGRAPWLPFVVLASGLLTTALSSTAFLRAIRERDQTRFQNAIEATEDRIHARVDAYLELLAAGRGFLAGNASARREDFRIFADGLDLHDHYPGVQAIAFAAVIPPSGRSPILDEMYAQTEVPFRIWPDAEADRTRSAIVWIEPLDRRNRAAVGFDMASEPVRREALFRARDTGLAAASGRVTLVQEIDERKQAGFLLYLPVYEGGRIPGDVETRRRTLRGWVYSPFRADDLFERLFGSERFPRVAFAVYDGEGIDAGHALHRSDTSGDEPSYRPRFTRTSNLTVAGRRWTLEFRTRPAFEETPSETTVALAAVAGLALTIVLFGATRAQYAARAVSEASERRVRFLAEVGAALGELRAPGEAATALATTVVPEFVDACSIDLVGEGGALARVELANAYPITDDDVRALRAHAPTDAEHPALRALASGETVVSRADPRTRWVRGDASREAAASRARAPSSIVAVPMVARGRTLGVVTFSSRDALAPEDVALAEELVRRTALAIDKAQLYVEAREAVRARDVFLSIASHELKTPLTSLKLHAQRFVRRAQRGEAEHFEADEVLSRSRSIDQQATRLNALVDELLDVSRITAGRMRFTREPVDLGALVVDVVARFGSPLVSTEIARAGEQALVGHWDRLRVDQVATNLVSNALKYGAGKPVVVRVDRVDRVDPEAPAEPVEPAPSEPVEAGAPDAPPTPRARLTVSDQGIGIAAAHQARIFERFERFVSERHFGGFGLGLWISRQIVEGLGGTIRVESEPGRGSTFVVELPMTPPEPSDAPRGGSDDADESPPSS